MRSQEDTLWRLFFPTLWVLGIRLADLGGKPLYLLSHLTGSGKTFSKDCIDPALLLRPIACSLGKTQEESGKPSS